MQTTLDICLHCGNNIFYNLKICNELTLEWDALSQCETEMQGLFGGEAGPRGETGGLPRFSGRSDRSHAIRLGANQRPEFRSRDLLDQSEASIQVTCHLYRDGRYSHSQYFTFSGFYLGKETVSTA